MPPNAGGNGASRNVSVTSRAPRIVIIGAGMSGLCMAAKLRQAGIEDFTIFEKAGALGGTWRDNRYPGLSCDIPSRFYQFTFAPNPNWSRFFSPGAEIWRYLEKFADDYGIRDKIEFHTEVERAEFADGRWQVRTTDGRRIECDFLISACGVLHHPSVPEIDGLDRFEGAVFHSARWDHEVPLEGRRVAVVGTGSTGVQLVCGLAGVASRLKLFQRTAQWVFPVPNPRYSRLTRFAHRRLPWLDRFAYTASRAGFSILSVALVRPGLRRRLMGAICRANLRTVRDRGLRHALTPDYQPMCKRLVFSGGFYRAMQRDDVDLVTDPIDHAEPHAIVTRDGVRHEIDVLVLATGFDTHAYMRPVKLVGRDGITLDRAWREGPRAYKTVALPDFPNFFMLMGPHSPVGNYSLTAIAENQADHIMSWIEQWRRGRIATVAPTAAATESFNAKMRASMPDTVWATGCNSWYIGQDGLPEVWPWTPDRHQSILRDVAEEDFDIEPAVGAPATPEQVTGGPVS